MTNWDDIRVFLAVARAGSLSAAAPLLRMDPATLSRRVARLERALGQGLFVKSPQGYVLTEAGQGLMAHAARAEEALSPGLAPPSRGLSGQIRIGAPDGCANFLLPQVCAALQAANPGLELQILALPRVVNLSRREADMAIMVSRPDTARLSVQKIADYHLHLAAHAQVAARIAAPGDLRDHPIVGYIPDMIFDRELDYLGDLARHGVHLASNSVAVQMQMLRASQGVGIVHDFALPSAPELRMVLPGAVALTRSFYLAHHASDGSARTAKIVAALSAGLATEIARLEALSLTQTGPKAQDFGRATKQGAKK